MNAHLHHIKRVAATVLAATAVALGSVAASEISTLAVALGPWVR